MSTDCDVCEFNKPNFWLQLPEHNLKYLNQQAIYIHAYVTNLIL